MLYNEQSLKMFKISNVRLGLILMAFLLSEAALVVVIAVYQSGVEMIYTDPYRPSTWYLQCINDQVSFAFTIIVVVANGVLLLFGLYLAIKIRKLKRKLYNESRILAFVIYNIALLSVLVTILQFVGSVNREVLFIVRSLAIVIGNSVAVISLYANKIYFIRTLDGNSPSGTATGTTQDTGFTSSNSMNKISDSSVRDQMEKLIRENQDLKQKLSEFEAKTKQDKQSNNAKEAKEEEKIEEKSSSSSSSSSSPSDRSSSTDEQKLNPTP